MSAPREFAVTPPDLRLPGLILVAVLLACASALAFGWHEMQGRHALWAGLAATIIAPALVLAALFRRKVTFDGHTLYIVAGLNQTRVAAGMLSPGEARVVDLATNAEYRLGIKSFGTSMPGYHAGHFRQVRGRKVFALVTDKHRVLVLPERDSRLLMLSLDKPQALLDALHQAQGHGESRR